MEAYVNGVRIVGTPKEIAEVLNKLNVNTEVQKVNSFDQEPFDCWANDWPGEK